LTNFLRKTFKSLLTAIASWLDQLGISPDLLTVFGTLGHMFTAWIISQSYLVFGALSLLFFGVFDALDGSLARLQNREDNFGAFLDSVCDRISEVAVFFGIFLLFIARGSFAGCLMVFLAGCVSMMVSYARARAESLGVLPSLGLMTRVERYLVLFLALLFDRIEVGLMVIIALGLFTIGQRIYFVYQCLHVEQIKQHKH